MKDNALISVRGLEKSFGKDIQVLKGIDIDIFKGDVVVVLGPSGSGKSTFLRCLNRLEEPTGGHIFFEGTDITDPKVNINVHRQKMGMVFQQFNLFPHKTVIDNLTMAPVKLLGKSKDEAKKDAMDLLERVGLAEKANAYPNQLSGGQKQRIAIVRALAKAGMTMVVVTHEIGFAKEVATDVVFIDDGVIKEKNNPQEFFNNPQDDRLKEFLSKVL